ncbi:MAG: 3-dehydroquinate synthase [Bacteroidales bacterium]|jgi:3-dehydroquinate synthase|nr:3-dehydroquinate synthase [Bacteroidales bacterium]
MNIWLETEAKNNLKNLIKTCKINGNSIFVLCDDNSAKFCLPTIEDCADEMFFDNLIVIPQGEEHKNIATCCSVWQQLMTKGADKKSVLLCVGGGIVCDLGGFVAATYKRGIKHVLVPTTLLSQVDAAIGDKTAINFEQAKNQIGLFAPAIGTYIFPHFLKTLPEKEVYSGFSEMLKHALIADRNYWQALKLASIEEVLNIDLIQKSIDIKLKIVEQDRQDESERRKLNFGHTIGHAIEALSISDFSVALSHGHAVALGMIAASYISKNLNMIDNQTFEEIKDTILTYFSVPVVQENQINAILDLIKNDKKREGSSLNFTLLTSIGTSVVNQQVSNELIEQSLKFLFSLAE